MRTSWGQPAYNPPSRFLDELPADTVHWARPGARRRVATGYALGAVAGRGDRAVHRRAARRRWATGRSSRVDVGDRVSHDAFGLGTVVEVTGAGDKAQATVDFGSGGTKRLVLRYAPLVKL